MIFRNKKRIYVSVIRKTENENGFGEGFVNNRCNDCFSLLIHMFVCEKRKMDYCTDEKKI